MGTKYKYNEARREWSTLVYDGTLTETGAKHRRRISSKKSSKDLENKVNDFKATLNNNAVVPSMITFGEYSQKWLTLYKSNKELNTQTMYKNALKHFEPINNKRLSDITRSDFQYIINLKSDHPRTCVIISQTFKQIIKSAVIDGYLPENSAVKLTTGVSLPKYQKREKTPLTVSETNAILNAPLTDKEKVFMYTLYYTGIRKGEALALTVNDIDLSNGTLTVIKSVVWDKNTAILKPYPKSNNGVRSVPLCAPLCDVLRDYMANCTSYLFLSNTGQILSDTAYKRMMQSINKKLSAYAGTDIHITAHRLRHNFCSLLCYQVPTISTKTIARILGDTEEMVLKVYSHIIADKEDIKGAINATFNTL